MCTFLSCLAMGDFRTSLAHLWRQMAKPIRLSESDQEPSYGPSQAHLSSNEYAASVMIAEIWFVFTIYFDRNYCRQLRRPRCCHQYRWDRVARRGVEEARIFPSHWLFGWCHMDSGLGAAQKGPYPGDIQNFPFTIYQFYLKFIILPTTDRAQSCLQCNEGNAAAPIHDATTAFIPRRQCPRGDFGECQQSAASIAAGSEATWPHRSGDGGQVPQNYGLPKRLCAQIRG